jgi:hypothetical protein
MGIRAGLPRRHRATVVRVSYLDELAAQIEREVPSEMLPRRDTALLFRLYALLLLAKGTAVTARDVHDAWAIWMQEADPGHHAIRPYEELDPTAQASDEPFVAAIRSIADRVKPRPA